MSEHLDIPLPRIVVHGERDGREHTFVYQDELNEKQALFHDSEHKFRWLGGGVGGGKSVAGIVEAINHSWCYPDNYGFILRKTFPQLRLSVEKDFPAVCPDWMVYAENHNEHWKDLINQYGYQFLYKEGGRHLPKMQQERELRARRGLSRIEFISYEGTKEAEEKFRSSNIGWYFIEQAEQASLYVYNALNQRMRRVPSARQAWFVSNPDGKDWLWYIFSEKSPDKRNNHLHIPVELTDNPALPDDYHETLKDTYDEKDYKRFVEGSHDVAVDAVFPEFSFTHNVVDHFEPPADWKKGVGLDPGIADGHATAYVLAAKFPDPHNIIYIYHEYEVEGEVASVHARSLLQHIDPSFEYFEIDPDSKKKDRVHGDTTLGEYRMLGIPFNTGPRDPIATVNRIKEYLRYDETIVNPLNDDHLGSARLVISNKCSRLIEQIIQLRWEEQKTGRGSTDPPQRIRDYRSHAVAALRYLFPRMTHPLSARSQIKGYESGKRAKFMLMRSRELQKHREVYDHEGKPSIAKLIEDSHKLKKSPRRTIWRSA